MNKLPSDIRDMDLRIRKMQDKRMATQHKSRSRLRIFMEYAFRMAAEFGAPVIIGLCIGYVLDRLLHTKPIIMLILAIFGVAAGTLNLYRAAQQIDKDMDKE